MEINIFFCYVLGKPKILGEKKIISLLYTYYFKVLSKTDQKQFFVFVVASNNKKGVHFLSWVVSKRLYLVNL